MTLPPGDMECGIQLVAASNQPRQFI